MNTSEQQRHILDLIADTDDNLLVEAGPGTGKTYMLRLIDNLVNIKSLYERFVYDPKTGEEHNILYLAFNRRIVEEANEPDDEGNQKFHDTTAIRTLNGAGHRIWGQTASGRLTVDTKKTINIFRTIVESLPDKEDKDNAWNDYLLIKSGVDMAKALGYVPEDGYPRAKRLISTEDFFDSLEERPSEFTRLLIDEILLKSIQLAYSGSIDYNDQLYMPTLFGGSFPSYPLILVDEKQDFSPINDEMLRRYAEKGARIVAVGDTWQSIYAFRGAVQGGMEKTKADFNCTVADLSVSFRCPSEIVKHQTRNPKLTWSREGGRIIYPAIVHVTDFPDDAVIICRNNAPLFTLALRLLASKRGVNVTGTDIGYKVINIMNKLGKDSLPREQVLDAIEAWRQDKLSVQSTTANDTADCMRVFACFGKTLSEATGYAEHLFAQRGAITLTTGHKAKGLEWEKVYHLDRHLIRTDIDEQEKNLDYVITTRSAEELTEIESERIVS